MAEKILMPQLGESVTEGTISKWLVKKGDYVKKYEPICEVSTDKVNAEVPSSWSGTVTDIVVPEGETVSVGTLIGYIEPEEASHHQVGAGSDPLPGSRESALPSAAGSIEDGSMKLRYSPAVRKLAQEYQLDLSRIRGSGLGGRITRKDVWSAIEAGKIREKAGVITIPPHLDLPPVPAPSVAERMNGSGDQSILASGVRKTIAQRMVQSKREAPHAWMMVECDVSRLVRFRNQVKEEFKRKEGIPLTYLPFFIKAVVEAIKEFPVMNSQWTEDRIIVKKGIHISLAVATEDALFVPVIKDADQKSIFGLAKAIDELVRKTREGRLTADDVTGGTFTCNNTGSFGSVLSAPIINPPQAAILTMEAIVKRPVVIDEMIAIRDMVNLCLSMDHRVLDGLVCGRFLQSVKKRLESFGPDTQLY